MNYPNSITTLIHLFQDLPGVGPRTAERYVFNLLSKTQEETLKLAQALVELKEQVKYCTECNCVTDQSVCIICSSKLRDRSLLCVISDTRDMLTIESAGLYNGLYFCIGGEISISKGINPSALASRHLISRMKGQSVRELIIALSPNIEGETTAMYVANLLKSHDVSITRLARGLPMGANIEYADDMTIRNAFKYRNSFSV